jgi:hypothetical protein
MGQVVAGQVVAGQVAITPSIYDCSIWPAKTAQRLPNRAPENPSVWAEEIKKL